jgi:hypothetical protein
MGHKRVGLAEQHMGIKYRGKINMRTVKENTVFVYFKRASVTQTTENQITG